ncbi:MAG TPA: BslA/BslB family hydrophobin [Clostridia bacterium]|nr:BslA/BslB family hydrophobin [Clostridia bacterium]
MSGRLKRVLSLAIIFFYLLSVASLVCSQPSDIAGSKAAGTINKWLSKGLTSTRSDGKFKPNEPLKRIEFFSMINKVFNYNDKANVSFTDVIKDSPYINDISKAVAAGYLQGDKKNRVYPFSLINRLDAARILVKVFEIKSNETDELAKLADINRIPDEYRDAVNTMLANNYMSMQDNKKFNPYVVLTRADAISLIDNIMGELYKKSGSYTGGIKNNVVINTGSVTLKRMTIKGDLYLTEGIGNGTVTFDSVDVKGRIIVHGGGNTVTFKNSSTNCDLIIDKKDGKIRLTADGYSNFPSVVVKSGATLENTASWVAGFRNVKVADSGKGQLVVLNGNYDTISIEASGSKVQFGGSTNNLQILSKAADSNIRTGGGVIGRLDIQAPRTVINIGGGSVTELNVNQDSAAAKISVSGSTVQTFNAVTGMYLEVKSGSVNTLNLQKDAQGSVVQIGKDGTIGILNAYAGAAFKGQGRISFAKIYSNGVSMEQQPSSYSIQSGLYADIGIERTNPVSTLPITASDLTVQKGSAIPSVVTVFPSDAKLCYSSSDKTVATVDPSSGLITGIGAGTTTVVVTGSRAGYFNSSASFKVTVTPLETVNNGTLSADVNSAVVGTVKTITLKYVPGEPSINGTFNFILPVGFTATQYDTVDIAGMGTFQLNALQILNGGQTVSIMGATLGTNQNIVLVLKDKTIPSAGVYNFKVTADSDGQGPKAASSGTGTESVQFESVARTLIWSSTAFQEASANDGSVSTVINLTLTNETFAGGPFVNGTQFVVTNGPAGLTVSVNKTSSTTATITLTGNAASHTAANSIANLGISFKNIAFSGGNASIVTNSAKTNLTVTFNDPDGAT